MAESKPKRRVVKKPESVRERAQSAKQPSEPKVRKLRTATSIAKRPAASALKLSKREYHPIKLPDNRAGRFLTQKRRIFPRFFGEAWAELRQVTWPNRRETAKLTMAVIIFAIIFGSLIAAVDWGIDKIFQKYLLS